MGVRTQFNKIKKTFSSMTSGQDELSKARDEILQGIDPRDEASRLGMHPSNLAEKLEKKGEEELDKAEEAEAKIRNGVESTETRLDEIGSNEVENPDLAKYENYLETAEERLEAAEEGQEQIAKATEDAEGYFKASLELANTPETQVGDKRAKNKIEEARKFENRIENDLKSVDQFRELIDNCWKKIDLVRDKTGDEGIKEQNDAVREVARMIHSKIK